MNGAEQAQKAELMALAMTWQVADELRATGRFDRLALGIAQADARLLFAGGA
jgi:hypothetical protein